MSNDVFPTLPGLKWGTVKAPIFSTKVLTAASQRETRGSFTSYPRWRITKSFEFLRNGNGYSELDTLAGFFMQRLGQLDNFLVRDESDYQVNNQALGVGDGVTKEFRFVRSLGGFVEPVLAPDNMWVYLDRGAALGKWRVSNVTRTNEFARSDDLTNSYWTKGASAVTANATSAPDGSASADLLVEDDATSTHYVTRSLVPPGDAGVKHVFSAYVKPSGRTVVYLKSNWDGGGGAEFDLAGDQVNFMDGGVIAAGLRVLSNGWHRIWIVVRPTTADTGSQVVYLKSAAGGSLTYDGNGTSGCYITWLQCEQIPEEAPNEPTEYIASVGSSPTTVAAAFGDPDDFGYFSFASAVPNAVLISWSGTFYFRVRFTHDTTEFTEFMRDLYEARKVEFISEK